MADSSRFRFHKNGPEASAMYNQKWAKGCYGCLHNKQTKTVNQIHYCIKSVEGFPNMASDTCKLWARKR